MSLVGGSCREKIHSLVYESKTGCQKLVPVCTHVQYSV